MVDTVEKQGAVAPADEVEITPAMTAAGAAVLCGFETLTAGEEYWADEVYRVMRRAAVLPEEAGHSTMVDVRDDRPSAK
jgi:hypothetical protein